MPICPISRYNFPMEHNKEAYIDSLYKDFAYLEGDSHKGKNGRTLLIGSSHDYPTSLVLAAEGAVSSGVGYVSLLPLEDSYEIVAARSPLQCIYKMDTEKADSVLFGNGVKDDEENAQRLSELLSSLKEEVTLIIDATGIAIFKKLKDKSHRCRVLLTPHIGEASHLLGFEKVPSEIETLLEKGKKFSITHKANLLLKGVKSHLIDEEGGIRPSFYGPTASLAKAGSGDVLAGFLAGLLARFHGKGIPLIDLVSFGDWLFHYAMQGYEVIYGNAVISATDFPKALRILISKGASKGA